MRSEKQVLEQILNMATTDDNVRAVMMNGSRVNPNAPRDMMQDYDVVFFINNLVSATHRQHRRWIAQFGELVMLQQNDFEDGSYIFLMQFNDGVRIDLYFNDIGRLNSAAKEDSLSVILLDKDGIAGLLPEPNDSTYFVKKPSRREWDETLNELWWIQIYIVKEIWRDELPLVKHLYDTDFVECLSKLMAWHIGQQHDWQVNPGKGGKWFRKFLGEELYGEFASMYCGADYSEMWESLLRAGVLIRRIGTELADKLGYAYPMQEDINTSDFIRRIQALPREAGILDLQQLDA